MDKEFAILINPKTRELFTADRSGPNGVDIRYPGLEASEGGAYWDTRETFEVENDAYYRSHSPQSGVKKGKGNGVVLYSALALRAFSDTPTYGIASSDGGLDHSTRSNDADQFWLRAVETGLAIAGEMDARENRTFEVDSSDLLKDIDCDYVGDSECESIDDVESQYLEIQYTAGSLLNFQYIPAENVVEKGLVFFTDMSNIPQDWEPPPPELLAALDLSNCYRVDLVDEIIGLVRQAGLELDYLERLLNTVPPEIYKKSLASKQLKFEFSPNRRYRKNPDVEKNLDRLWDAYFGELQEID